MTGGNEINYKVRRNHFPLSKSIQWKDVIDKLNYEYSHGCREDICKSCKDILNPPTFLMISEYFPNSIGDAYEEVCIGLESKMNMHLYTSLGSNADTFGRHKDTEDVMIVQSVGRMIYKFDDGCSYTLCPGDSIFIGEGVYHNPIVIEPRVTLSFSW